MEFITRPRLLLALPWRCWTLAALVAVGSATAAPKTVNGTVGPGFTISLKLGGKKVTRLKGHHLQRSRSQTRRPSTTSTSPVPASTR